MILRRLTVEPFAENTYVIGEAPRVALVDPGAESERTIDTMAPIAAEPLLRPQFNRTETACFMAQDEEAPPGPTPNLHSAPMRSAQSRARTNP